MEKKYSNTIILTMFLVIAFAFMSILSPDRFLSLRSFQSMTYQLPELGLLTLAMMISIISGGINLSTVNTASLSGVVSALIMVNFINPEINTATVIWWISIAIVAAIATSLLCGLFNGFLIGIVGVTPILVTLGTLTLFRGLGLVIAGGRAGGISGLPSQFLWIGNERIFNIPVAFVIFVVVTVIIFIIMKSSFGLSLYMIGANPVAAKFSGINTGMVLLKTYVLSGLLCGIASIIMISRYNSAKADYGISYLLISILAVILGGISISGGQGFLRDVIIALVLLQIISTGFNIFGLGRQRYVVDIIWGSLIILMLIISFIITSRRNKLLASVKR